MRAGVVLAGIAVLALGIVGVVWGYSLLVTSALGPYFVPLMAVTCGIPLLFLGLLIALLGVFIGRRAKVEQGIRGPV